MKIPTGWRRILSGRYQNEFDTAMIYRVRPKLWVIATRGWYDGINFGPMLNPWVEQQSYRTAGECFKAIGKSTLCEL